MDSLPTATALNRMTVSQLKDVCKEHGLALPEKPLKKNLIELVRTNIAIPPTPAKKSAKGNDDTGVTASESPARNYAELVTDAFGYMSREKTSEFQAHYKAVARVFIFEAITMFLNLFMKTSETSFYEAVLFSSPFHQAFLYWFAFLVVIPMLVAIVCGDRNAGAAYSTLVFAMARYVIVYIELPVTSTIFEFLPLKFFSAACSVLAVTSFWTHVSWVESPAMMDFDDVNVAWDNDVDDDEA